MKVFLEKNLLLKGYLKIASRFIIDMENISYHVAAGKISKELLHEIFESYFEGTFDSEEMKVQIYEAISDDIYEKNVNEELVEIQNKNLVQYM